jgi:hypothetical protein
MTVNTQGKVRRIWHRINVVPPNRIYSIGRRLGAAEDGMALAGNGAVCIWNGIANEGRATFYDWHVREHMPERLAIPGFLRGRRFVAIDGATAPEFFTLYETETPAVLVSGAYLARLNAPTPWTREANKAFQDTSRALVSVVVSLGPGPGGILATVRYATPAADAALTEALAARLLPRLARLPQITGVHLCLTDGPASGERSAESRGRTDIQSPPDRVVMIEGCNVQPVDSAVDELLGEPEFAAAGKTIVGRYRLEYMRMPTDRG